MPNQITFWTGNCYCENTISNIQYFPRNKIQKFHSKRRQRGAGRENEGEQECGQMITLPNVIRNYGGLVKSWRGC